jgi:DNA repair exonuclease SbcCD ATPase subunit
MTLIYFYGSRYNIHSVKFLDIINHAEYPYYNQLKSNFTVDILETDIRLSINESSRLKEIKSNIVTEIKEINDTTREYKSKNNQIFAQKNEKNNLFKKLEELENLIQNSENSENKLKNKFTEIMKSKLDFMSFDGDIDSISDSIESSTD